MRVYTDSSALIKRSVQEAESDALEAALGEYFDDGAAVLTSSLTWVEVSRALRKRLDGTDSDDQVNEAIEVALSGVAEREITGDVVSLARRVTPRVLRTLEAVHLGTAILLDADVMLTYDDRLAGACRTNGIAVSAPAPKLAV